MRKLLRILGVVGLTAVVLMAVSSVSNLVLGAYETANIHPYGQRVSIDGGQVNVSVTGDGEKTMVLMAHSLAGIYSLDYVNRFPGEVSALVTIDGTVPEDFAVAPKTDGWARFLSTTGWVRWLTALDPAIAAPSAPDGVYSERDIEQIRLMTIRNYANPAAIDENNRSAENFAAVGGLAYPTGLPVLAFVSRQLIDANTEWLPAHAQQLESLNRSELVVLDGGHYLHWTHSREMAEHLSRFLG